MKERRDCWKLIVQNTNYDEFCIVTHILDLIEDDVNAERFGLVEPFESYMSMLTYKTIRDLITFPKETTIVDVGCGLGIQQILFKDCYKYIGLDKGEMFKITENSEFIKGDILETLPNLKFETKQVYGISVLCAMCFPNIAKVMKDKFDKLIIV